MIQRRIERQIDLHVRACVCTREEKKCTAIDPDDNKKEFICIPFQWPSSLLRNQGENPSTLHGRLMHIYIAISLRAAGLSKLNFGVQIPRSLFSTGSYRTGHNAQLISHTSQLIAHSSQFTGWGSRQHTGYSSNHMAFSEQLIE